MKINEINEAFDKYLNEDNCRYFSEVDLPKVETTPLETELFLWEHNCIWDKDHIVNCLDQCLSLMGYTKQAQEENLKYYPKYKNDKYIVEMGACRHPGGYWIHVKNLNEDTPLDGVQGTAEHESKFAPQADSVEQCVENVVGLLKRIKEEKFKNIGE